ncbi:MAG: protoporphyrinogen oxidase, partial [Anaerolineae bacterium]|nr:protoporphyrinogen oxidase [Anaerolineae bacterium]
LNNPALAAGRSIAITILDSADYWGGKIKTDVQDGFVVEGGPDAYLVTKPQMRALAHELGLQADLQGTNPDFSATYILNKGRLASIPTGLTMTIPTEFAPMLKTRLLTWPQKIRMGFDFIIPPSKHTGDESLAGFISRRLGRAAYEKLVGPLLSGIYAGDGDRLSLQSTFPNLRQMELEHGGLIKGALALRRKRAQMAKPSSSPAKPKSRSIFESPRSGLVSIVNALVKHLEQAGVDMRLQSSLVEILPTKSGYILTLAQGAQIPADAVVLAAPAYVAGQLLQSIAPQLAHELAQIEYVSTATVSLAYPLDVLPSDLSGYGYIIPQHEDSQALACTWTSSKWHGRAPQGFALLRVFVGRIQDAQALPHEESALIAIARRELRQTMHITAEPANAWVFRWEKAMPQYNLGHPERLERIQTHLAAHPALALAGSGYHGIGMPDCIRSGILAAEKIAAYPS